MLYVPADSGELTAMRPCYPYRHLLSSAAYCTDRTSVQVLRTLLQKATHVTHEKEDKETQTPPSLIYSNASYHEKTPLCTNASMQCFVVPVACFPESSKPRRRMFCIQPDPMLMCVASCHSPDRRCNCGSLSEHLINLTPV